MSSLSVALDRWCGGGDWLRRTRSPFSPSPSVGKARSLSRSEICDWCEISEVRFCVAIALFQPLTLLSSAHNSYNNCIYFQGKMLRALIIGLGIAGVAAAVASAAATSNSTDGREGSGRCKLRRLPKSFEAPKILRNPSTV